jgi:hypothetical protein
MIAITAAITQKITIRTCVTIQNRGISTSAA